MVRWANGLTEKGQTCTHARQPKSLAYSFWEVKLPIFQGASATLPNSFNQELSVKRNVSFRSSIISSSSGNAQNDPPPNIASWNVSYRRSVSRASFSFETSEISSGRCKIGEKKEYLLLNSPSWNDRRSSLRDGLYVERLMTILGEKAQRRRTIEEEQHNKTQPHVESDSI